MDLELKGKRAIITGGTRGIGRAIADQLAAEGADVAICARTEAGVIETVEALKAQGVRAFGSALDVRDADAFRAWHESAVRDLGGVDIAISNVSTRPTLEGEEGWREAFDTDFLQHVRFAELSLPKLAEGRDANLLFLSSIAATLTILPPGESAYGTMKAALISYMGQLASTHGSKGVRVNAVSPGPIFFPGGVWDQIGKHQPDMFKRVAQMSALGRHGTPEEVADAVVFLCSPKAGYITGANLRVDGAMVKTVNH